MSATGEGPSAHATRPVQTSDEVSADMYTIALFCVTKEEGQLVRAILDRRHEAPKNMRAYSGNYYSYGEIEGRYGVHHIVVIRSRQAGKGHMMTAAAREPLRSNFPNLEHAFAIGISGGLSSSCIDTGMSVYKGDVVIAKSVYGNDAIIEYDHAVMRSPSDARPKDRADKTAADLESCFDRWYENFEEWNARDVQSVLESLVGQNEKYHAPSAEKDFRFLPDQAHCSEEEDCSACRDTYVGGRARTTERTENCYPLKVHRGLVLTGSPLIRSAQERERISLIYPQALCVDMESAVLMDVWHPLVIRGISDYADSHYDYDWLYYAAATAAAVAKSIILTLEKRRPSCSSETVSPEQQRPKSPPVGSSPPEPANSDANDDSGIEKAFPSGPDSGNSTAGDTSGGSHGRQDSESSSNSGRERKLIEYAENRSGTYTAKALRLIGKGTDVTASNCSGNTALHYAVRHPNTTLTEALIAREPDTIHQRNRRGETPLHRCVQDLTETSAKHADLLIKAGKDCAFDFSMKDLSHKTAFDYTITHYPRDHCLHVFEKLLGAHASWTSADRWKYSSYSEVYRRIRQNPTPR